MGPLLALLLAAPPLPPECEAPELRDVSALKALAQRSGSLSVGLDSVATWCFDSGGQWTGGQTPKGKKAKAPTPDAEPLGECAKALQSCLLAKGLVPDTTLLFATLGDLPRPYLGRRYTPKRSGLAERPSEAADCESRVRSELFTHAQARMDLARLASLAQNEYANYKTWLLTEGMRCAQLVRAGKVDQLRKGMSIDTPVAPGKSDPAKKPPASDTPPIPGLESATASVDADAPPGGPAATAPAGQSGAGGGSAPVAQVGKGAGGGPGAAPGAGGGVQVAQKAGQGGGGDGAAVPGTKVASAGAGTTGKPAVPSIADPASSMITDLSGTAAPTSERARALAGPLPEKWRYFAEQRARVELDRDYTLGFLSSRELRECGCPPPRVAPSTVVNQLKTDAGAADLEADEARLARCELCLLDKYPGWRARANKQCSLMDQLSDYELGVLERSDDGNGLPPRCFEAAKARRAAKAGTPGTTGTAGAGGGAPPQSNVVVTPNPTSAAAATPPSLPPAGGAAGKTVYVPPGPPPAQVSSPIADSFVRSQDYAPIPMREDGRLYVRIFMSSACVAEILPGPLQARTGDLLLIPYGAKSLSVRSPCGGLAEVYWGREERPRVSELFGRSQPLTLQFRPQ